MPRITSASNRRVDLCDWNDHPIGKINNVDAVNKVGLWLKLITSSPNKKKARSSTVVQNSSASALQEIKLLTDKTQATQGFESCSY